jgi:chromate transporter
VIYLELLLGFLKVGLFTFGGGYAAVPLIRDTVMKYGWMDDGRLSDLIAVSESTPGPIMVNMATYIGSTQAGFLGALVATLAVVMPAFTIMLLIMKVLKNAVNNQGVQSVFDTLKPCIVGIILATGVYMTAKSITENLSEFSFDVKALAVTVILAAIYFSSRKFLKNGISPIVLILIAGVAGIVFHF